MQRLQRHLITSLSAHHQTRLSRWITNAQTQLTTTTTEKMDSPGDKSMNWPDEDVVPTADPNLTMAMISEELPALTVTTIVGMTVVMLIAILAVFILGVLIDCRQQRLLEKKMGEAKRMKTSRRVNTTPEADDASIANNMEEPGMSVAPAEALRHIP